MRAGTSTGRTVTANPKTGFGRTSQIGLIGLTRLGVRAAGVWLGVFVVSLALCAAASASGHQFGSPGRLAALDPGARLGGNTIVATGSGASVFAVPDRPNFIVALGAGETITASGKADDQIGALGKNVTIRAGAGDDLVYGGPGGTLIGGSGPAQLVDTKAHATVQATSSHQEVIVTGHEDRVLCSSIARDVLIYHGASDSIGRACRADHARVLSDKRLHARGIVQLAARTPVATATATVTGDGTNFDPFSAPCASVQQGSCTVTAFPARTLSGFWANEFVPAYRCPDDYPYLLNQKYAPVGTYLPPGVEIQEDWGQPWPIAISITVDLVHQNRLAAGISTGALASSATNWTSGTHSYKVVLRCTNIEAAGYKPSETFK